MEIGDAIEEAKELGRENAPDTLCSMCARVPISGVFASDFNNINKLEAWAEDVINTTDIDVNSPHVLIDEDLDPAFRRGFGDATSFASECDACNDSKQMCGHEQLGQWCPAQKEGG